MTDVTAPSDAQPKPHRVLSDTGISAGVAGLFLLLRVMAVADWDWHTATVLVEASEVSDIVPMILVTLMLEHVLIGVLVMWLLPVALLRLVWPLDGAPVHRHPLRVLTVLALAVVAVTLVVTYRAWWLVLGCVLVGATLVTARLLARRGSARRAVELAYRSLGVTAAVGALILATVVTTPWVSKEEITRTSGEVLVGYVIEAEPGFVKVLTEDDRHVLIIPDTQVRERHLIE